MIFRIIIHAILAVGPYWALGLFVWGLVFQIVDAAKPSTAGPDSYPWAPTGRAPRGRLLLETILIGWPWRKGWRPWLLFFVFHWALLLTALAHLRYFMSPVPDWVLALRWPAPVASLLLAGTIFLLVLRRLTDRTLIPLSGPRAFFPLLLLLALSLTGLALRHAWPTDLVAVKAIGLGLIDLHPIIPRVDPLFLSHFVLALILIGYWPYSRLWHGVARFFLPGPPPEPSPGDRESDRREGKKAS